MSDIGVIAIRAFSSIILLFVITRILGKKQISQLTFFEYITGITLGDLVGFMSTDVEANYWHGLTALSVWFIVPLCAEILALKSQTIRNWLEGKGTVFIQDGKILERNLRRERYTSDELMEQLRTKSIFTPADVEFAILEPTGDLSVLLKEENQPLTPKKLRINTAPKKSPHPVIMDGNILKEGLEKLGFDEGWLKEELGKLGLTCDKVFLAVADPDGGMYVDLYKDRLVKPQRPRQIHRMLRTKRR